MFIRLSYPCGLVNYCRTPPSKNMLAEEPVALNKSWVRSPWERICGFSFAHFCAMATSGEAATSLTLPYTLRDVAIWKHLEHFKVLVRSQSLRVCQKKCPCQTTDQGWVNVSKNSRTSIQWKISLSLVVRFILFRWNACSCHATNDRCKAEWLDVLTSLVKDCLPLALQEMGDQSNLQSWMGHGGCYGLFTLK